MVDLEWCFGEVFVMVLVVLFKLIDVIFECLE